MNTTKTYQLLILLVLLFVGSPTIMAQNSSAPIDREFGGELHDIEVQQNEEERPFLGVFLKETDEHEVNESGETTMTKKQAGVQVDAVIPNTSAEKAGLKDGDRILKINSISTNTMEELVTELKKLKVNDKVNISFIRDGSLQTTSAILMPYNEETVMAYKKQKYGDKKEYNPHKEYHHQEMMEKWSNKPFLGVVGMNLNEEVAKEKSLSATTGLYLKEVVKESSAEKAGLQAGDVIINFNGEALTSHDGLVEALKGLKVEDEVKIEYIRNNQTLSTTATLGKRVAHSNWSSDGHGYNHKNSHCSSNDSKTKETNSNKALLGVYAVAMDASIAEENDIRKVEGLYLKKVIEGSAADEAGLQQGDVLLMVNKSDVYSHNDLIKVLANYVPGDVVDLKYRRDNKAQKTRATLKSNDQQSHKSWSSCYSKSSCKNSNTSRTIIDNEERVFIREVEVEDTEGNKTWVKVMMMDPAKEENTMLNKALKEEGKVNASKQAMEEMPSLNLQELTFSPNPNRGQFSLSFDIPERGNTLVRITDTTGKVAFEEKLENFEGQYNQKIDISENYKGLYYLQVIQGDKVMTKKIVVQ